MKSRSRLPAPTAETTNIGLTERKVRLWLGYGLLATTLILAVVLLASDAARWWRLLLVIPFYQGLRFLYDARTGVCPLKAELGQERRQGFLSTVGEKILDPERAAQIRRISRAALVRSVTGAVLFTAIVLILP